MPTTEHEKAEQLNRTMFNYARNKNVEMYKEAVRRAIIETWQADSLLELWDERHPYEPLVEDDPSVPD